MIQQTITSLPAAATLAALIIAGAAACGGRSPAAGQRPGPGPYQPASATPPTSLVSADSTALPGWVEVDSAAQTVTLELEVTSPPGSPSALINRYRAGEVRVTVPLGWTVKWNWRSADSTAPHSLVAMIEREKFPLEGGRAAFSNAMTRMVTSGLQAGESDRTTFVADEAGWYWLLCGVPGHAVAGEWISLRVDREARLPSVVEKG